MFGFNIFEFVEKDNQKLNEQGRQDTLVPAHEVQKKVDGLNQFVNKGGCRKDPSAWFERLEDPNAPVTSDWEAGCRVADSTVAQTLNSAPVNPKWRQLKMEGGYAHYMRQNPSIIITEAKYKELLQKSPTLKDFSHALYAETHTKGQTPAVPVAHNNLRNTSSNPVETHPGNREPTRGTGVPGETVGGESVIGEEQSSKVNGIDDNGSYQYYDMKNAPAENGGTAPVVKGENAKVTQDLGNATANEGAFQKAKAVLEGESTGSEEVAVLSEGEYNDLLGKTIEEYAKNNNIDSSILKAAIGSNLNYSNMDIDGLSDSDKSKLLSKGGIEKQLDSYAQQLNSQSIVKKNADGTVDMDSIFNEKGELAVDKNTDVGVALLARIFKWMFGSGWEEKAKEAGVTDASIDSYKENNLDLGSTELGVLSQH